MNALSALSAEDIDSAAWRLTAQGVEDKGLRALDGADGQTTLTEQGGARCLANKAGTTPASVYLYFKVDDALAAGAKGPFYVIAEYFSSGAGGAMQLQYDSATGDDLSAKYLASDDQWCGQWTDARQWRTCVFLIEKPLFKHRENLGADFRLYGGALFVRSVRISRARPPECERLDQEAAQEVKPRVKIGAGGQLIIGGFDAARREDVKPQTRALRMAVPAMKALGVTSHEVYVRWRLCEPEPGRYDWSAYDAYVNLYKKQGIRWVPFLVVGSPYTLPDWYYKKPESQGYVCLEHNQESDVQSLWNPALRGHVARFIKAFCEHYRDSGVIESILLGVTGNYGEAIYPATGNDWTADIHGQYHTHGGFWAGDKYAIESFRDHLKRKYSDVAALNKSWKTSFADFAALKPFLRKDAPNDRAWLDFCEWYIGSMTEWSRFWMSETRKHFPKGDVYLCTGGHAPAEHGSDFGAQCKAAAEERCGVRITNEGSDYARNFMMTRWVASAGRQYGAYFSFEPAGPVNPGGVVARVYNATASGARGLHYYYDNIFWSEESWRKFEQWGGWFEQRSPIAEIAVYYPETSVTLSGGDFLGKAQPLRDRFDFDFKSDGQIQDGGLKSAKALILISGAVSEGKVWRAITSWVQAGGLLIYAEGMGRLRTVEGDERVNEALFSPTAWLGKGRVKAFKGASLGNEYREFIKQELAAAPGLLPQTRRMVRADGVEDGIFVTLCAPDELLWYDSKTAQIYAGDKKR
ncbi:MAG: family 14 glycosylhydrolase [Candidatus Sumerlaeota bacterium]|nr:family 14 glycosylhydrolase [Candidatus Sumerlaeota bacterium]